MKAIFFMFLLCCICCLSCSDEQNTLSEEQNVIENKTFEKVSSLELKQQLLDYLNNSVKTRTIASTNPNLWGGNDSCTK